MSKKVGLPKVTFFPTGFDDNDNTELVIKGFYPDACYRFGQTYKEIDHDQRKIFIVDTTFHYQGMACAEVTVPYVKEVSLGQLKEGKYQVYFENLENNFIYNDDIEIAKAKSGTIDDHLYAPIEQATFKAKKGDRPASLVLGGEFHNTCMYLDRVEVRHPSGANTIDVLPIAELKGKGECRTLDRPREFSKTVDLSNLPNGLFLLHIRSLNGKAVNRVVSL